MGHLLPPHNEILSAELARLYKKRLLLDELIRNLERYAEFDRKPPAPIPGNTAVVRVSSQLSGL